MRFKCVLLIFFVFFSACAKQQYSARHYHSNVRAAGRVPTSDVPLQMNDRVAAWIDYFQGPGRSHFERYLERSGRYINMMRDVLRENGLPQDLVYVALIESGFSTGARSHANAVGPWQFIRSTGLHYGLDIDRWVDERRDPIKSTWSAARYFKYLYSEFHDWYLALAAYNAGEGTIGRAVSESGSRDFWKIADSRRRYLRAETRDYVPKFIAATIMAKSPQKFGFSRVEYQEPLDFDVATVESQTDIQVIADCSGTDVNEISELNPHLVRGTTPPSAKDYVVKLPKGAIDSFKLKYASLPKSERVRLVYHKVRRGETVVSIAQKYGVSKNSLLAANDISPKRKLKPGTRLLIPRGGEFSTQAEETTDSVRVKKLITHKVKKGETLPVIARNYGVSVSQIKSWNPVTKQHPLIAGRSLRIYQPVAASSPKIVNAPQDGVEAVIAPIQSMEKKPDAIASIIASDVSSDDIDLAVGENNSANVKPTIKTDESAVKKVSAETYKMKKGDSLVAVAKRHGVTVGDLMKWNDIKNPKMVREGKTLKINLERQEASLPLKKEEGTPEEGTPLKLSSEIPSVVYEVKKGDTLWNIARRYKVTIAEIQRWNSLSDSSTVKPGDQLTIRVQ